MKSLKFYPTDRLPEEYRRDTDYLVAWNDLEIAVGDRISFTDLEGGPVAVECLWLVIGSKILENKVMEVGHDCIVRFDRSIGCVEPGTAYTCEII